MKRLHFCILPAVFFLFTLCSCEQNGRAPETAQQEASKAAQRKAPEPPKPPAIQIVGDPQIRTDHPWFPGELSCSTFPRLFETQSRLYERVTGRKTDTDEDKAVASWFWRNINYYHMYSPQENYWDSQPANGRIGKFDSVRDYWTGLFAYGFGLCGTTHAQFTAEMEHLLGHCTGRVVGVSGHNSYEVFLRDPQYGEEGDWALLDHDISTIVFDDPKDPKRLMSLWQITYEAPYPREKARSRTTLENILDNTGAPDANRGWFKSGLYFTSGNLSNANGSDAIGVYTQIKWTEPLSGYPAVPPMISLKRNEAFRRYLRPGLGSDTFVFWGHNDMSDGIPGPSRDRTWVSQPEKMFRAGRDTGRNWGRYGNAVYTYKPNFKDGSYREGAVSEDDKSVTFYFYSPYAVGATPPAEKMKDAKGVEFDGCSNGLVVTAGGDVDDVASGFDPDDTHTVDDVASGTGFVCTVQLSTDNGTTWSEPTELKDKADLTDLAKSHHSYHLKLNAPARDLAGKDLTIQTVCIANDRLMPHLKDGGTNVTYEAGGKAVFAAGPNGDQAKAFLSAGDFGQNMIEFTIPSPNGRKILEVHAAAWAASGVPPDPALKYQIEYSTDGGQTWKHVVKDWNVELRGYQAKDWWSQSFCYGNKDISDENASEVKVRFSNPKKSYRKAEVYLVYETPNNVPVEVTFNWNEGDEQKTASHVFTTGKGPDKETWTIDTGQNVVTNWVEMKPAAAE